LDGCPKKKSKAPNKNGPVARKKTDKRGRLTRWGGRSETGAPSKNRNGVRGGGEQNSGRSQTPPQKSLGTP